jgi:hypothetical protein
MRWSLLTIGYCLTLDLVKFIGNGMFSTATLWMQSANDALPIGELKYSGHDKHDADPVTFLYLPAEQAVQPVTDASPE